MEKEELLPRPCSRGSPSPPPYEVPAYQRRQPRRRLFIRGLLSIRTLLSFVIAGSVLWLCIAVNRQSQLQQHGSSSALLKRFEESLAQCEGLSKFPTTPELGSRKSNSRWSSSNGQKTTIVLRNTTLFDGEAFIPHPVDIVFSRGLIESVSKTSDEKALSDAIEYNLHGRYVTPGLVDMHSHHLAGIWPGTEAGEDGNEMHPDTKAFTPMVRIIDALKAYDEATAMICSGGVTSSLILPGSANLIGGEGVTVKNAPYSGQHAEPVVEDLLLERGVPPSERRRYMKMAFGENPKATYGYTRLGNAWHLREHLQKAKELKEKQDDYCAAMSETRRRSHHDKTSFIRHHGKFPFQLELETTIGVLRGRVIVQNHNYEPEDMETMLRISHEFGYRVWGFHHATEAWQVPNMLKEQGDNVTMAIFSEFSLYKQEAVGLTNAKYLANHAAIGHAFHLPEEKALQSITSIPAKAIDLDFRVGYCRPGFDADIVVWDSHPLSRGATPLQVFVDGQAQLDQSKVEESLGTTFTAAQAKNGEAHIRPQIRYEPEESQRAEACSQAYGRGQGFIVDGIQQAFVDNYPELASSLKQAPDGPIRLVVDNGKVACLGSAADCAEAARTVEASESKALRISLQNGYVLPGLTAVTRALGMNEIATLDGAGDGQAAGQRIGDPESLVYAKYGVWLDGKAFARARLGGVTRAITLPMADSSGFVQGVSAEILTSGKRSLTGGGIVQGEVALHLTLGDATKESEGTVSSGVQHLRKMLKDGTGKHNETLYGQVAAGELPLVVYCNNKYDMAQLVMIKKDFPKTNLVILGGKEAPYVAKDLAAANISVILSENRPAPDIFRDKDAVVGPPLTRSVASYLREAGVTFALTIFETLMPVDYRVHDLGPEAGWAAKYAGLSEKETVHLVTTNVESILGLKKSKDLVVFEGSPLEYGASVVLSFHADEETGKLEVASCFPREDEYRESMPLR